MGLTRTTQRDSSCHSPLTFRASNEAILLQMVNQCRNNKNTVSGVHESVHGSHILIHRWTSPPHWEHNSQASWTSARSWTVGPCPTCLLSPIAMRASAKCKGKGRGHGKLFHIGKRSRELECTNLRPIGMQSLNTEPTSHHQNHQYVPTVLKRRLMAITWFGGSIDESYRFSFWYGVEMIGSGTPTQSAGSESGS